MHTSISLIVSNELVGTHAISSNIDHDPETDIIFRLEAYQGLFLSPAFCTGSCGLELLGGNSALY